MVSRKYGIVYCSGMQFPDWYKDLESMQGEVQYFEVDSEVEVTIRNWIFEVKSVSLHCT